MSFVGVCYICENAEGRYTCDQCGSLVCEVHYVDEPGLCTQCATGVSSGNR